MLLPTRVHFILFAILLAGCAPLTPTPPFHFGETAKVLPKGVYSGTLTGGTGKITDSGSGSGAGLRGRYGFGHGQEAGAELSYLSYDSGFNPSPSQPWNGPQTAYAGKLSWKISLRDWLAFSAGAGGGHSATGDSLGGDAGIHLSSPGVWKNIRAYGGLRYGIGVPCGRDMDEAGGLTQGLNSALGLNYEGMKSLDLFLELGSLYAWNRGYNFTSADAKRKVENGTHSGSYLALGVTKFFGGEARPWGF